MADRIVATYASELRTTCCRVRRFDSVDDFLVAVPAGLLGNLDAVRSDLDIVLVAARSEEK